MAFLSIFRWRRSKAETIAPPPDMPANTPAKPDDIIAERHFYNGKGFQCFASFFPLWDGWATAGHVLTDAAHNWPAFTGNGEADIWPDGLDAALKGCRLPDTKPRGPVAGRRSRHMEFRDGVIYIERGAGSGTWIIHITQPDEPVVSGMSGGPVIDIDSGDPIGIVITRNSPADLNADKDPDESCDFVALSKVWDVLQLRRRIA